MRTSLRFPVARVVGSTRSIASGSPKEPTRFLVTGSNGQIGSELVTAFRKMYGNDNVIASDIRKPAKYDGMPRGPFKAINALDMPSLEKVVVENDIECIVHLSAIMSVVGEANPQKCLDLNVTGLRNVLELSRNHNLRCFAPSTMAVFGADAGKVMTKDDTILNPTTVYGITKVFLEQLGAYYARKYDIDFRCLRYPGIISADTLPGGGTTDYAVWMYHNAIEGKKYTCPVNADEPLPMMYMPDCLESTVKFITAPRSVLKRNVYNISAQSFTPAQQADSIRKFIPGFEVDYKAEIAQDIAHSWPDSMDDNNAQKDFGWEPKWDLDRMSEEMIKRIRQMKNLH